MILLLTLSLLDLPGNLHLKTLAASRPCQTFVLKKLNRTECRPVVSADNLIAKCERV